MIDGENWTTWTDSKGVANVSISDSEWLAKLGEASVFLNAETGFKYTCFNAVYHLVSSYRLPQEATCVRN